jgi:parallel beta-helix repeat protein
VNYTPFPVPYTVYNPHVNYGFFFQNHENALTSVGEWCTGYNASTGTTRVRMYFGANSPASYVVKASVLDIVLSLNQTHYITVDGLQITGANDRALKTYVSNYVTIKNTDFLFSGRDAFYSADSASVGGKLIGNTFNYTNNNGIVMSRAKSWTIQSNVLTNTGSVRGMGVSGDSTYSAILGVGDSSVVDHNRVINTGYVGIDFLGNNITVQNNFVDTFCTIKDDGSGIYTWSGNEYSLRTGTKVLNNVVVNGKGDPNGIDHPVGSAMGIYLDDGSSGIEISGNTFANNAYAGIYIHNSHDVQMNNNTVYNNGLEQIYFQHSSSSPSAIRNVSMNGNIFFSRTAAQAVVAFSTGSNDIASFGTANFNYYTRPVDDNLTMYTDGTGAGNYVKRTLAGWQALTGQDANSRKSAVPVTDPNAIRFEYNGTSTAKSISLGATYRNLDGVAYPATLTLQPYTSAILLP